MEQIERIDEEFYLYMPPLLLPIFSVGIFLYNSASYRRVKRKLLLLVNVSERQNKML